MDDLNTAVGAYWDGPEHMFAMAQTERAMCEAGVEPATARRLMKEMEPAFRQLHITMFEEKAKSYVEGVRESETHLRSVAARLEGSGSRIVSLLADDLGGIARDFEAEMRPELERLKAGA